MISGVWVGVCCGLVVLGVELIGRIEGNAAMIVGGICIAVGLAALTDTPRGER